jgi:hypothetical protein
MIREIATRKGSSGYKGLLLIIAITAFVIIMSSLIGMVENATGLDNLEYIIYAMLVVLGFFVIHHFITQYRYSLFDDELIIEQMLGKKITPVVNVFIWDILSFEKINSTEKVKIARSYKLYADNSNKWSITFKKDCEIYEAVFSPSDEFVGQLKSAIEKRQHKQEREPNIIT